MDQSLANEIYKVAEDAKTDAQNFRNGVTKAPQVEVTNATQQELNEITQAPVNVDQLIQTIRADNKISVRKINRVKPWFDNTQSNSDEEKAKPGFFKSLVNKIRGTPKNKQTVPIKNWCFRDRCTTVL